MQTQRSFRSVQALLFAPLFICAMTAAAPALCAQSDTAVPNVPTTVTGLTMPTAISTPIAVVPLDNQNGGPTVTGALEVTSGRAIIAASGSITSGTRTTEVALPRRGTLRVCASTTVKLASDSSVPASDGQGSDGRGLLMALDAGAVEMSFATTRNADILLTPDFRILIGGPGAAEVKVRLGYGGDTCVDNPGADAPYVLVNSLFTGGLYRVQPGQRVMFQHGDLGEVVDQEKEPCGCPPAVAASTTGNEFPLAQSEGLAPMPAVVPAPPVQESGSAAPVVQPFIYTSPATSPAATPKTVPVPETAPQQQPAEATATTAPPQTAQTKQPGLLTRIGRFFKRVFGAE